MNLSTIFSAVKRQQRIFPCWAGSRNIVIKTEAKLIFHFWSRAKDTSKFTLCYTDNRSHNSLLKQWHANKRATYLENGFSAFFHLLHPPVAFFQVVFPKSFPGWIFISQKITFEPSLASLWNRTIWIEVYGKPKKLKILKLKLKWLIRRGLEDDTKPLILVVWLR